VPSRPCPPKDSALITKPFFSPSRLIFSFLSWILHCFFLFFSSRPNGSLHWIQRVPLFGLSPISLGAPARPDFASGPRRLDLSLGFFQGRGVYFFPRRRGNSLANLFRKLSHHYVLSLQKVHFSLLGRLEPPPPPLVTSSFGRGAV